MKLTFFFLILFTISSCANQARRPDINSDDIEESETRTIEKESPKSSGEDRATKGEIDLDLKGESTETIIIDSDEETQPSVEVDGNVVKSKQDKEGVETDAEVKTEKDCIPGLKAPEEGQEPPLGWNKRCELLDLEDAQDDSVLIIKAPE